MPSRSLAPPRPRGLPGPLLEAGQELGIRGHGRTLTVSRNVFIPLTNLCRNRCGYCTFAVPPDSPQARTYRLDEVGELARRARPAGGPPGRAPGAGGGGAPPPGEREPGPDARVDEPRAARAGRRSLLGARQGAGA